MKDNFNLSHKVAHQLLSLYKKQFLNVKSLFFNKNILLLTLKAAGYAIITHKNYKTLKNQMIKLQLACGH